MTIHIRVNFLPSHQYKKFLLFEGWRWKKVGRKQFKLLTSILQNLCQVLFYYILSQIDFPLQKEKKFFSIFSLSIFTCSAHNRAVRMKANRWNMLKSTSVAFEEGFCCICMEINECVPSLIDYVLQPFMYTHKKKIFHRNRVESEWKIEGTSGKRLDKLDGNLLDSLILLSCWYFGL